jgi:hypothetical protein
VLSVASSKLKDHARRQRLIALWQQRFLPEERTEAKVSVFCAWLEQNHPQLLERGHGDPYQQLNIDLSDYILRAPD